MSLAANAAKQAAEALARISVLPVPFKKFPAVTAVSAATPALSGGGSANSSWNATTKLGNAVKVIPKVTYAAGKLYMFDDVCAQGKLIMDGALTYYQCGHE